MVEVLFQSYDINWANGLQFKAYIDFWEDWGFPYYISPPAFQEKSQRAGLWLQQRCIGLHNILQMLRCVQQAEEKGAYQMPENRIFWLLTSTLLYQADWWKETISTPIPHLWLWLQLRWYTSSVHCIKTFDVPHGKASENGTTRLPCLFWCSCRLGRWCSSGCGGPRFSLRWLRP